MSPRDFKYAGHRPKASYQRKSQADVKHVVPARSGVWPMMLLFSLLLLMAFFVINHFVGDSEEVSSLVEVEKDLPKLEVLKVPAEKAEQLAKPVDVNLSKAKQYEPLVVAVEPKAPKEVNYSFYKGLAASEVVVDVEPISVKLSSPYFIQAGTFRKETDARKEQARLRRHGQSLFISSVVSRGKQYYRLRIGPFDNRLTMNKKRNELRRLGMDTQLIKVKATTK